MRTKSIIKAEEKLNRFNHVEFNFKADSIEFYVRHKYDVIYSHIDSDHKNYHNRIEVMIIKDIDKRDAFELAELIKHTYQLDTYYCNYSKHLEITLYQHLE